MGTLICGLIAGVISWNSPKIYRISMVLQPAKVGMDEFGRMIQVDSADNIKALIEARTFNKAIKDHLKSLKIKNRPDSLIFRVTSPRKSDIIKISYETTSVETGITILNQLTKLLRKEYKDVIKIIERNFEAKIKTESDKLRDLENKKMISINNNRILQKRLEELNKEIKLLEDNNNLLIKHLKNTVNTNNINLPYTSTIQENLRTINEYKNQMFNLISQKERTEIELKRIEEKIDVPTKEIAAFNKEKDNIQYIQVLQTPTSSRSPIRPKPKVAVLVASVTGLFLMVVTSFFIEYISGYRSRKHP